MQRSGTVTWEGAEARGAALGASALSSPTSTGRKGPYSSYRGPHTAGISQSANSTQGQDGASSLPFFLIKQGPSDPGTALGSLLPQLLFW